MTSSSPWFDQSGIEAPAGRHAGEFFGSQYDYGFDRTSIIFPYPYNNGTFKRLPPSQKKRMSAVLAAFASLVAIVMLIYTCNLVYSRVTRPSITKRRLSDDDSDSDPGRLGICEDTDDEDPTAESSPTTPDTASEEDLPGPSSKVAKVEIGGKRTAKMKHLDPPSGRQRKLPAARRQRGSPSGQEGPDTPQDPRRSPTPQPSISGWLGAQQRTAGGSPGGGAEETPGPTPQHPVAGTSHLPHTRQPFTVGPRGTPIQYIPVVWIPWPFQATGLPGSYGAAPQLQPQPSSAAAQGPAGETTGSAVVVTSPTSTGAAPGASPPQHYPGYRPPQPGAGGLVAALLRQRWGSATSTGADASTPQPQKPQPSSSQLPAAAGPVFPKPFDPHYAMHHGRTRRTLAPMCCALRELLARKTKGPMEVHKITLLVEEIVHHMVNRESSEVWRMPPSKAVEALGRRYIAFLLLVSALPVIGESSSADWFRDLATLVPHAYVYKIEPPVDVPARKINWDLALRLSAALETLKTGVLPDPAARATIEKMLFRSEYSPRVFNASHWDPWRQADTDADGSDDEDGDGDKDAANFSSFGDSSA